MNTLIKTILLSFIPLTYPADSFSDESETFRNSPSANNQAVPQTTMNLDFEPSGPGMSEENRAMEAARSRYRTYVEQEGTVIRNDRAMMQKGYDPNERYGGFPSPELNGKYPGHDEMLRGKPPVPDAQAQTPTLNPGNGPFSDI